MSIFTEFRPARTVLINADRQTHREEDKETDQRQEDRRAKSLIIFDSEKCFNGAVIPPEKKIKPI
jgi:ABC-type transport system involved in Fe-S cluster assembly fused permease/ATPase subunit